MAKTRTKPNMEKVDTVSNPERLLYINILIYRFILISTIEFSSLKEIWEVLVRRQRHHPKEFASANRIVWFKLKCLSRNSFGVTPNLFWYLKVPPSDCSIEICCDSIVPVYFQSIHIRVYPSSWFFSHSLPPEHEHVCGFFFCQQAWRIEVNFCQLKYIVSVWLSWMLSSRVNIHHCTIE